MDGREPDLNVIARRLACVAFLASVVLIAPWRGGGTVGLGGGTASPQQDVKAASPADSLDRIDNRLIRWGVAASAAGAVPTIPDSWKSLMDSYGGIWLGDTASKQVFLTFDAGYEAGYTSGILDVLKTEKVPAAFFITGYFIDSHPELVLRMVVEGHTVGNHTRSHRSLPSLEPSQMLKDLAALSGKFESLTGGKMRYMRPPSGELSERTLAVAREAGYVTVLWSLAFKDWEPLPGGPDESYRTLMARLHSGAVILLHVTSKDDALALSRSLQAIREQGYAFGTLDQILERSP